MALPGANGTITRTVLVGQAAGVCAGAAAASARITPAAEINATAAHGRARRAFNQLSIRSSSTARDRQAAAA